MICLPKQAVCHRFSSCSSSLLKNKIYIHIYKKYKLLTVLLIWHYILLIKSSGGTFLRCCKIINIQVTDMTFKVAADQYVLPWPTPKLPPLPLPPRGGSTPLNVQLQKIMIYRSHFNFLEDSKKFNFPWRVQFSVLLKPGIWNLQLWELRVKHSNLFRPPLNHRGVGFLYVQKCSGKMC